MTSIERTFLTAAVAFGALNLAACGSMGGGASYSPRLAKNAADEKAFASTFASCRDEVRDGKTSGFKVHPASAAARDLPPGPTGLVLKVPYDKAKGGSRAARSAQNDAHKAAMGQCLSDNGYQVASWDAVKP